MTTTTNMQPKIKVDMDSHNSLSSLTHTSTLHTKHTTALLLADSHGGTNGADNEPAATKDNGESSGDGTAGVDALTKLQSKFNLKEFLVLANKVVDVGDLQSMKALTDLMKHWIAQFGDENPPRLSVGLRPVSSRILTPCRTLPSNTPDTPPTMPALQSPIPLHMLRRHHLGFQRQPLTWFLTRRYRKP
ncbi:UNVERIFIED_CONTAM: hypothetical protein Slati_0807600 [Sesamum latifolium]|uniref:Uncharacterized protein n=1 Tax=Sesamum latifolium TaxID=2727402 RepID=A0AAW2XKK5_9LAMI